MFRLVILVLAALQLSHASLVLPSATLPPTPQLPTPREYGYVNLTTVDIWYAQFGPTLEESQANGMSPVLFIHGAFANSDYWAYQVESILEYSPGVTVLTMDSRMQGRSTGIDGDISYKLMREDVEGVLDYFGIPKVTVVGWSDGGIIGLNLAINAPERVDRLFAFAASYAPDNIQPTINDSPVWSAYVARTAQEYQLLSPSPDSFSTLNKKLNNMFATLPNYDAADFARIPTQYDSCGTAPLVWIVDAANEEAIKFDVPRTMHDQILGSALVILPDVSHFAFLQDPWTFNLMLGRFLGYTVRCWGEPLDKCEL